jgi:putative PIN family toxin of toxin-antitoxin system
VRVRFLLDFERSTRFIDPIDPVTACRDPKDDKFLSLGCAGHADAIVTGDNDLLTLNPFRGVAILTPQGFVDRFRA